MRQDMSLNREAPLFFDEKQMLIRPDLLIRGERFHWLFVKFLDLNIDVLLRLL